MNISKDFRLLVFHVQVMVVFFGWTGIRHLQAAIYSETFYQLQVGTGNSQTDRTLAVGVNNGLSYSADAFAVGTGNFGYLYNSGMFGSLNVVTDTTDSGVFGNLNHVDGASQSLVVGSNNDVGELTNGAVIGHGLSAGSQNGSLTIGSYNLAMGSDTLFTIGNGYYSTESNASSSDYFFHNALTIDNEGVMNFYGSEETSPSIVINPNVPEITINGVSISNSASLPGGGAFSVGSNGQASVATGFGQSMFVGREMGGTYSYPAGIFQAITDNFNGSANYYFQGITGGPSGSTNFSVRADGYGYFAGSVGIGTAIPLASSKLDVNGATVVGTSGPRISLASGSIGFNRDVTNGAIFNSGGYAYQFQKSNSATPSSDVLALQVYNPSGTNVASNALAVTGAGNIGIGLNNPQAKLDVSDGIFINNVPAVSATSSLITSDGSYYIAWGARLSGTISVAYEGPNRVQNVVIAPSGFQFDHTKLNIFSNSCYGGAVVLSNFRVLRSNTGADIYLVVDVSNRNGGDGRLSIVAQGPNVNSGMTVAIGSSIPAGVTDVTIRGTIVDASGNTNLGGDIRFTKRQGDIVMGEFGNPNSGD